MLKARSYYKELLSRFILDELDANSIRELYTFIKDDPDTYESIMKDLDIFELAGQTAKGLQGSLSKETNNKIKHFINSYIREDKIEKDFSLKRNRLLRKWYWVAASAILLFGIGVYFYRSTLITKHLPSVAINVQKDILAPGASRAMITLGNGSKIYLDSAGNGQLMQQGNIQLIKRPNGQIAYQQAGGSNLNELQYNTLTNPKGSRIVDVFLSDGTHVWLNAGSSITYPVAFVRKERIVELKGEGYFEVAKDPTRKFIVNCNGVQTEVLGTHFNIKGFETEVSKITLLEGAIKVTAHQLNNSQVLKPGEQASIGRTFSTTRVDVRNVMAWKEGFFDLDGLSFTEFMHQLERWYNIEVIYTAQIPTIGLFGKLGRDLSLPEVVSSLKDMGVNCKIEQRKLYILK